MLLITGGTGFIGRNLTAEIAKERDDIRILTRDYETAKRIYPQYEIYKGDITRPESITGIARDVDVVMHLAGMVSYTRPREEIFRMNVEGTKNVLFACQRVDKFILSSSVSVYGEIKGEADESYPRTPLNAYGESKREAENLVRDSHIPNLIFRIAPVYGKGSPYWLKNLSLLEKGFPIPKTENLTHVTHVSNASQAFRIGIRKGEGIYNIADKSPVKFVEFAKTLQQLLGRRPKVYPRWLVNFLARLKGMKEYLDVLTMNRAYDIRNAELELKYDPELDFVQELKGMVDWYKKGEPGKPDR